MNELSAHQIFISPTYINITKHIRTYTSNIKPIKSLLLVFVYVFISVSVRIYTYENIRQLPVKDIVFEVSYRG